MAEVQGRVRGERVEVAPATVVVYPRALGPRDGDRQRVVVVRGVALGHRGAVLGHRREHGRRHRRDIVPQPSCGRLSDERRRARRQLGRRARRLAVGCRRGELRAARRLRAQPHVERERQAARPAARLEELRDVDDDRLESARAQLALQARRAGRHDDRPPDDDGVRAERGGLVVGQRDRVGDERGDRVRRPCRRARRGRTSPSSRRAGRRRCRRGRSAGRAARPAGSRPSTIRARSMYDATDERERCPTTSVSPNGSASPAPSCETFSPRRRTVKPCVGEPALGMRRLGTPLGVAHARGHERAAVDDAEVRREDEVGQAGLRLDHLDLRAGRAVGRDERVPLALRALAIDADREVHPRVDRVADVEMRRRAHEVAPPPAKV